MAAIWESHDYWSQDAEWLVELLPKVRAFLIEHEKHNLVFGEEEDLGIIPMYDSDYRVFDWLSEEGYVLDLLPRYFVERLHFQTWAQVREYVSGRPTPPWWWNDPIYMPRAKVKFILTVRSGNEKKDRENIDVNLISRV